MSASAVGMLYYVNTLGAGAACLACIVLLFPFLGTQGAIYVAVAMNVAVAVGALVDALARARGHAGAALDAPVARAPRKPLLGFAPVLTLAAAGGFVSLVLRDLLLPHRVLCDRLERDRLRGDAERVPGRPRLGRRGRPASTARRSRATRRCGAPCAALMMANLLGLALPAAARPSRLARPRRDRRRHADGPIWWRAAGARCCPISPSSASPPTARPACAPRCSTSPTSWAPPRARS